MYISHVQFKLNTTRDLGRPTGQSLKTPALHTVALHICLDVVDILMMFQVMMMPIPNDTHDTVSFCASHLADPNPPRDLR